MFDVYIFIEKFRFLINTTISATKPEFISIPPVVKFESLNIKDKYFPKFCCTILELIKIPTTIITIISF